MRYLLLLILPVVLQLTGCYSFTGASVPPHLKTIAIPLFDDQSGSGKPGLRELLTNKLLDKFRQDNSLSIADKANADALLEGTITSVLDQPQVLVMGETVTKSRVTISVKVIFQDLKLKKKMWEKQFSQWADYALGGGSTEFDASISAINEKLSEDILLEAVAGW
jgi:Lipopolysaccharide-assembly